MSAIYKEGYWYGGVTNAEDISVKVGQNTLKLNDTIQDIIEDLAPIETNSTNVTNSYKIGDLLTYNGVLYKVIDNIAVGDPLLNGTNITETTITQGVDLTDRVVALENKTQKISQLTDSSGDLSLKVDDNKLYINKYFVAGTSTEDTGQRGLLLRSPNRSIDTIISGNNSAGLYDRGNAKWILNSNSNGSETKTDATTFVCGNTQSGSAYRLRAQNSLKTIDLLASTSGRCGVLDRYHPDNSTEGRWLIFVEATTAAANDNPNVVKTDLPFYLNATTASELYSRRHVIAGFDTSTTENVCRAVNKTRSIQLTTGGTASTSAGIYENTSGNSGWILESGNNGTVKIPRPTTISAALTVNSLTSNGNISGTNITGSGTVKGAALTSTGTITSGGNIVAGTSTTNAEVKCCVYNKTRRIYMTTGNVTNQNAGIWDEDGSGSWILRSDVNKNVYVPHPFTTTNFSAEGNAAIKGNLTCRNAWSTRSGDTTLYPVVLTSTSKASVCGFLSTQATTAGVKQLHVAGFFGASNASAININASSSDRRLKRNIQLTTKSGLDLINKLDVVEFDWKDGGHWDFGIVAQDAGKIDKNIVPNIEEGEKENQWLNIDTLYLVDALIKATQELSAEVDQLKERVKILEKEKDKKSQ